MAVYSTEENRKDECLEKTLESLQQTVDFRRHKLALSINARTFWTQKLLKEYRNIIDCVFVNDHNIGTARAINRLWYHYIVKYGIGNLIKMDDDVVVHSAGWVDEMEEAIRRDPNIGLVALKRKDLMQCPWHENEYFKSEVKMLPHEPGEPWIIVEETADIMGTCVMHSAALIEKVGALYQPGKYGFDDAIMAQRSRLAGFYNCFLPHIRIDHVDDGKTPYQQWKEKSASKDWNVFQSLVARYKSGELSTYYSF